MNVLESLLIATPSIVIALCGIAYQIYLNRNKPALDKAEEAHKKVETDSLKTQIAEKVMGLANSQIKSLSDRLDVIEKELTEECAARAIAEERAVLAEERAHMSEERAITAERKNTIYLNGIYILTNQLFHLNAKPLWSPAPTGPLSKPDMPA